MPFGWVFLANLTRSSSLLLSMRATVALLGLSNKRIRSPYTFALDVVDFEMIRAANRAKLKLI